MLLLGSVAAAQNATIEDANDCSRGFSVSTFLSRLCQTSADVSVGVAAVCTPSSAACAYSFSEDAEPYTIGFHLSLRPNSSQADEMVDEKQANTTTGGNAPFPADSMYINITSPTAAPSASTYPHPNDTAEGLPDGAQSHPSLSDPIIIGDDEESSQLVLDMNFGINFMELLPGMQGVE